MSTYTVVHIDSRGQAHPREEAELAKADAALVAASAKTPEEMIEAAKEADGILSSWQPVGGEVFTACPSVKVIVRYGIGFDNIDLQAATDNEVVVCNITDYCIDEVATHAVSMVLALNRKLVLHNNAARTGERQPLPPSGKLRGETIGLVGFGNIARAAAVRAQAFGLKVVACDPYIAEGEATEQGVELVSLTELLSGSDYVSVHTPLNAETRGLIGAEELALMKPSAYLVTTCRGGVVDEWALYEALKEERIAGAGVDVWDPEPVQQDHPLLEFENVIATPHSAYYSDESVLLLQSRVGEAAADVLRGYLPRNVVNRQVLERVELAPHPDR